jgi:hypothetical protein
MPWIRSIRIGKWIGTVCDATEFLLSFSLERRNGGDIGSNLGTGDFTTMSNILNRRRSVRKVSEFERALPELEAECERSQGELDSLIASRGGAFFDLPESEQEKLDARISEVGRRTRNLELAVIEAKRRRAEAVRSEQMREIESKMARAREVRRVARDQFVRIHEALMVVSDCQRIGREALRELNELNALARSAGRSDLVVTDPLTELQQLTGRHHVGNPISDQFQIRDYCPLHPDGPPLAAMKELIRD